MTKVTVKSVCSVWLSRKLLKKAAILLQIVMVRPRTRLVKNRESQSRANESQFKKTASPKLKKYISLNNGHNNSLRNLTNRIFYNLSSTKLPLRPNNKLQPSRDEGWQEIICVEICYSCFCSGFFVFIRSDIGKPRCAAYTGNIVSTLGCWEPRHFWSGWRFWRLQARNFRETWRGSHRQVARQLNQRQNH